MYNIEFLKDDRSKLSEVFGRPTIYLDHWALNDLALNTDNRQRFTRILNNRGGMLRISTYNIRELLGQHNKSQIETVLSFIDEVDSGFINVDPIEVIEKENQIIAGNVTVGNPSADLDIIDLYLMAKNHLSSWKVSEIIKTCLDEVNESSFCSEDFLSRIKSTTEKARQNSISLNKMKRYFEKLRSAGQQYHTATRESLRMVIAFIIKNQNMKMTAISEWNDIFHLIVPVSYCDIVLLDKRWNEFIKQTGLTPPGIAYVYDKRGIDDFFKMLEHGCFS